MKVYYNASLSRYRELLPVTKDMGRIIEELGHVITSRHVLKPETTEGNWEDQYEPRRLFEREMRRLANSDVLITEATTPSYGGGFIIQTAFSLGKPLLTLHYGLEEKNATLMLRGHPWINLHMYTEDTIRDVLKSFFKEVEEKVVDPHGDFDQ